MNTLYFNDIESLSFNKTFNFLGNIFCFSSLDTYSIKSRASGDPNLNSIAVAWSGMENIVELGFGFSNFILHGVNVGTGKIT